MKKQRQKQELEERVRKEMAAPDWSQRMFEGGLRKMDRMAKEKGSKVAGSYTSRDQPTR